MQRLDENSSWAQEDANSQWMAETDKVLAGTVNQIWAEYDKDGNGWLDRDEMKGFIKDILVECNLISNYNEKDFERVFSLFDDDGDGRISRSEMFQFIKKISEL